MKKFLLFLLLASSLVGKGQFSGVFRSLNKAAASIPGVSSPFVTTVNSTGAARNDYAEFIGYKFSTGGVSMLVTDLGRYKLPGNNGTHEVRIVDISGTTLVSAIVNMSGGTDNTFVYQSISPYSLPAGNYYLVSLEYSGGDTWYNDSGTSLSTSVGGVSVSVYRASGTYNEATSSAAYGFPNFKYQ